MNAREAAFLALLQSLRQEGFIAHFLEQWQKNDHPLPLDFAFAQEISYGAARRQLTLDYIATELSTKRKLQLKQKEKALIRTAIYQHTFMSKVPDFAIVNETIEIAKKYCHHTFVSYLNALLRKLSTSTITLPEGSSLDDLKVRYSYPPTLIQELIAEYGFASAIDCLEAGNAPPTVMARRRPSFKGEEELHSSCLPIPESNPPMIKIARADHLKELSCSQAFYIQNITPATLVQNLASLTNPPATILDLCAAPGGKLLAAHDLFPAAKLFANDISDEKINRLSQNFTKYNVQVTLSCNLGEHFSSPHLFDLIILDVPCSNSGVLNKRPEARWRITEEAIKALRATQMRLLTHAISLLSMDGAIWYLTCSILKAENEHLIEEACQRLGLEVLLSRTILPNQNGWDGGFACLLRLKTIK